MPMTLIQRQVLSGSQASVTFSNIPQNYQTLKIIISARRDSGTGTGAVYTRLNDSTSGYTAMYLFGNGSVTNSGTDTQWRIGGCTDVINYTSNTFTSCETSIPNYFSSLNKIGAYEEVTENNSTTSFQTMQSNLWSNTSSISSIYMYPGGGGNFVSGSTFSLYGIS